MVAGVNRSNIGLLQLDYEQIITEALATGANAFKFPRVENWEGEALDWRVHLRRNGNHGFTEDGGAYSVPGKQGYETARAGVRFFQKKLQISLGAMAAAKTTRASFKSVIDSEVEGATRDVTDWYNKMFFLDGTGVVATLKVDASAGNTGIDVDSATLLWPGDTVYQIYNSGLGTLRGEIKISKVLRDINSSGYAEFNVDTSYGLGPTWASSGVVATDVIVWNGSKNRAIAGLDKLIDDATGTFQNISVSDYPEYASYVNSNGTVKRPLTPQIFRKTMGALMQAAGNSGRRSGEIICFGNAWLLKEFEEMYEGAVRFNDGKAPEGFKSTRFVSALGSIRMEPDTDATRGKLFLADVEQLVHKVQKPLGFEKDNGNVFRTSHSSLHATAVMNCVSQMVIRDRKSSAKIEDLEDSATLSY